MWNGNTLDSYFLGVVGDGSSINFWVDPWLQEEPLYLSYPNLFKLEQKKCVTVAERVRVIDGVKTLQWEWRLNPSSPVEVSELFNLLSIIYDFVWKDGQDVWRWKASEDGVFTVSSAKRLISSSPSPNNIVQMKWKGWVPLKCKIFVWRAAINRIPTKWELRRRGVNLQSVLCSLCDSEMETATHMFTGCCFATEVWSRVEAWCRLSPSIMFDVPDIINIASAQANSKRSKYVLQGIVFTSMWVIWKERNERIFNGKRRRAIEVVESIKMTSYFWFRNRSRIQSIDWIDWCKYPLDVM